MIRLQEEPIVAAELEAAVADAEHGGTATFLGTTRREAGEREVVALDYEAYEELALSEMAAIAAEATARFGASMAIVHRTGRVPVGEASVAVVASAPHRDQAFAACRMGIDALKERVPIWKREVFADGESRWVEGASGGRSA